MNVLGGTQVNQSSGSVLCLLPVPLSLQVLTISEVGNMLQLLSDSTSSHLCPLPAGFCGLENNQVAKVTFRGRRCGWRITEKVGPTPGAL
jgi:hypothetical protein